jgi:GNAT superfamily N-acetyltransferase
MPCAAGSSSRSAYPAGVRIRDGLKHGDIGAVTRLHGQVYADEYGLDRRFEAAVAARLAELTLRGWPGPGEGIWIAESGSEPVGSVTLSDQGEGLARLGHVVLAPEARGHGLGRRLVEGALARARKARYARVELTTFSELTTAARIYRAAGFERVSSDECSPWGRVIQMERYLLELTSPG